MPSEEVSCVSKRRPVVRPPSPALAVKLLYAFSQRELATIATFAGEEVSEWVSQKVRLIQN